jgi:hypothetical protein
VGYAVEKDGFFGVYAMVLSVDHTDDMSVGIGVVFMDTGFNTIGHRVGLDPCNIEQV